MSETENSPEQEVEEKPARRGGFLGRLLVGAFVSLVIAGECCLAYWMIPSADEVKEETTKSIQSEQEAENATTPVETKSVVEIELGRFGITSHEPASGSTLRVDFVLVGTTLTSDEAEFRTLLAQNEHRFRDLVILEVRDSDAADLTDPLLDLIKRKILAKSNALFGKPILRSLYFSDYTFLDQ